MDKVRDVVVGGGGPAGIAAAIAAARMNCRTTLIEAHDVLGGMGTAGLVNNFCPAHLDGLRLIIGGIFKEIREELIRRRTIYASPDFRYMMEAYDPEVFASLLQELCVGAGVEVLLGQQIESAKPAGAGGPTEILLKGGQVLTARMVVDSTGNGHLAASCGARFFYGRAKDGAVMPLTYCYEIAGIELDEEDAISCRQFDDAIAQCCYAMDVHEPDSDRTTMREFERGTHFDIPMRCLIPVEEPANLVVGGRCISATQGAMSSFRISPSVMAIGEAAGVLAALAAADHCDASCVDAGRVQEKLIATGGILE